MSSLSPPHVCVLHSSCCACPCEKDRVLWFVCAPEPSQVGVHSGSPVRPADWRIRPAPRQAGSLLCCSGAAGPVLTRTLRGAPRGQHMPPVELLPGPADPCLSFRTLTARASRGDERLACFAHPLEAARAQMGSPVRNHKFIITFNSSTKKTHICLRAKY